MHALIVVVVVLLVGPPLIYFRHKTMKASRDAGRDWRQRHDARKDAQ